MHLFDRLLLVAVFWAILFAVAVTDLDIKKQIERTCVR